MYYARVFVAEATYHGQEALTYKTKKSLPAGSLVVVPLRDKQVLGLVAGTASRPSFAVKEIVEIPPLPPLPGALLQLLQWMNNYYPAPLGILAQHFVPRALPKNTSMSSVKTDQTTHRSSLPTLTTDQQAALQKIKGAGLHLLHGETGTGKTRVYIELAKRHMAGGKSSIILTPEIGLTSQLTRDFCSVFGEEKVVVIHSQLTGSTRQKLWTEILQSPTPLVIIGPRSALFSPLRKIGLIVVDESHEPAYKQDQAPYYHASSLAAKLADLHGATLVLGSATPLVSDYYIAKAKGRPIIRMQQTASQAAPDAEHSIEVIDLKDKEAFSRSPHISNRLIIDIQSAINRGEQALLFLNRRGTARLVFCEQCGWQAVCPHCDLPLVYHGDSHTVRCHSCSYHGASPVNCPDCGNPSIVFKSIGTKAITDEIRRLFPEATIQRFDTDNRKSERIETHYDLVRQGKVDIIIGTQTLAKGLDLPKLSIVGVINADTGLSFPDFSAAERTYQLLSQVLGRVGRGHRTTKAIIQTYDPKNPILKAVLAKNWNDFYNNELEERRKFNFPPFCYILKLTCRRASRLAAERAAKTLCQKLTSHNKQITIEGPAPSFHEKLQNKYQWQLVIKSTRRQSLLNIIGNLPSNWSYDIDPLNLL